MSKLTWGLLLTTSTLFAQVGDPIAEPGVGGALTNPGIGIEYPGDLTRNTELPNNDIRYGNWIIGNGGDTLPIAVKKAQIKAATIVEKL